MKPVDIFGIVGFPLGHSRSPQYFTEKFQRDQLHAVYLTFEIERPEDISTIFQKYPRLQGFNITIPHKQNILSYLDEISPEARQIGAVNCVKVKQRNGKPYCIGYNTDVFGFQSSLLTFLNAPVSKALILGNGGAAKAVRYALHQLNIENLTVSRRPARPGEIGYPAVKEHLSHTPLIINTTPLGTWPHTETCPDLPYHLLTPQHFLFDLVYNPEITTFMKKGREQGAQTRNGYDMWLKQAEKSWEIWNGNF